MTSDSTLLFLRRAIYGVRARLTWLGVLRRQDEYEYLESLHDLLMRAEWLRSKEGTRNPLNRFGAKYFSQGDEDGLTLEIIKRLGINNGAFAELGVGNGLENNTLILLASGWRGFWIGGEDLAFDHKLNPKRFCFLKAWVSLENVISSIRQGMKSIGLSALDVLSLDLDGNDYYLAREILSAGILPKLFILEYNAKFPPPIKWKMEYDASHSWDATDYQGASLASFAELLSEYSYELVCCNAATGANAFFVKKEYLIQFAEIPKSIGDMFVECRYQLYKRWGHPPSPKTVEAMLAE
jgi:hypothetical protein